MGSSTPITSCRAALIAISLALVFGCRAAQPDDTIRLTVAASSVGTEGAVLRKQLERFEALHPNVRVELLRTPDDASQRHQLFVQWLNAETPHPDVLQLDVIWVPEFAAAGWLRPLDDFAVLEEALSDVWPNVAEAVSWRGRTFAVPWFIDVGMIYYRRDLIDAPPTTLQELARLARENSRPGGATRSAPALPPYGLVLQGARYEGLVTVFVELLGAYGGTIVDDQGRIQVDSPEAARALAFLQKSLGPQGFVPRAALGFHEEEARLAFQEGKALFMRNWPYAYALSNGADSKVRGRFGVFPVPPATPSGAATAALGGADLALNRHSEHPELAAELLAFLTAPTQTLERAAATGAWPANRSVYDRPELAQALEFPAEDARRLVESATARPVTPLYAELSGILQRHLHRALAQGEEPAIALETAAREMRRRQTEVGLTKEASGGNGAAPGGLGAAGWTFLLAAIAVLADAIRRSRRDRTPREPIPHGATPWLLLAPLLLAVSTVVALPMMWALWESLHDHDLRFPWRGVPFVGLAQYGRALTDPRFWAALLHTAGFVVVTVVLELGLGLASALALHRVGSIRRRKRDRGALDGLSRAAALIPWLLPTVVAAMVWRFAFEGPESLATRLTSTLGLGEPSWFASGALAWVPLILADVWKTTPFVTLLVLAGLQTVDPRLYEAARLDGAGARGRFFAVTLPALRGTLLIAALFRGLDAFRVFDLVYVLTGGGPGTATESVALLTHNALLDQLRFGYGSALSVLVFAIAVLLAFWMLSFQRRNPRA